MTSIRSINLRYQHELSQAQKQTRKTIREEIGFFDFNWNVKKTLVEKDRIEGVITIDIPYANVWFKEEDEKLQTTLDLHLELIDSDGRIIWEHEDSFKVETDEQGLEENRKKKYNIKIPFLFIQDLDLLRQGKTRIIAVLKDRTGGKELKKVMEFKL